MTVIRRTFVLHVHEADRVAVLENVRTHERVRLDDLREIPAQIDTWLARDAPTGSPGLTGERARAH